MVIKNLFPRCSSKQLMNIRMISLLFWILISLTGRAQLYTPNNSVMATSNPATNNVGVGYSTPGYKFDVSGVIRSKYDLITTGIGNGNGLHADDGVGSTIFSLTRQPGNETRLQSYGYHTFYSGGNTGVERMRIDANGNVGIGTSNPSVWYGGDNRVLEIAHSRPTLRLTSTVSYDLATIMFTNTSVNTSTRNGEFHLNYQYDVNNAANSALRFGTFPAGEMFTLKSNGNVGIGSAAPAAKLEVNGSINVGLNSGASTGYGAQLHLLGADPNGDPLWISRYNTAANQSELRVNLGDDSQNEDMFVVGNHWWSSTEVWRPVFSVHTSGRVGIGTTSPDEALTVKGKIHTQEVRVDLTGAVTPDYVFEKDYNLLPLSELESYINTNKHLPEVPSAKEMEADGMNLKEMNLILLKKVEELTLHLIEKDKEVKDLKIRMKKIESKKKKSQWN